MLFQIDQGGTIFADRKFYLGNDSTRYHEAYTQYFVDIVVLLGGERAAAAEMADNLWEFESRLAEVSEDLCAIVWDLQKYCNIATRHTWHFCGGTELISFNKLIMLKFIHYKIL